MTEKLKPEDRLDTDDGRKAPEDDFIVALYGSEKNRIRTAYLYLTAGLIALLLIYPIMKFAIICYELGFVSKTLSAYIGGIVLVGTSMSASYLIGYIFLPKYFRGKPK